MLLEGFGKGTHSSPILFKIVMEALTTILVRAREMGVISGFEFIQDGEAISHLQFADDTILFSSTESKEILALKRILWCFQLVSELEINIYKSILVGIKCAEETIHFLASTFGHKLGKLPIYVSWFSNWGKAEIEGSVGSGY